MFSFFRRARAAGTGRGNRFVFAVEGLERRDVPSAVVIKTSPSHAGSTTPHAAHNQAPVISNFHIQQIGTGTLLLSGKVTDDQAVPGLVVTFKGIPAVRGHTAVVEADGTFSVTILVKPHQETSGTVTAHTADAFGKGSNTASMMWTF